MIKPFNLEFLRPGTMALLAALSLGSCSDDSSAGKDAAIAPAGVDAGLDLKAEDAAGCQSSCDLGSASIETGASTDVPAETDTDAPADTGTDAPAADTGADASVDLATVDAPPPGSPDASAEASVATDVSSDLDTSVCTRVCSLVGMVNCPGVMPCLPGCLLALQGKCASAGYALQTCVAARPLTDFTCKTVPFPQVALPLGSCEAERTAFRDCMYGP
jgi:hypothetical protein